MLEFNIFLFLNPTCKCEADSDKEETGSTSEGQDTEMDDEPASTSSSPPPSPEQGSPVHFSGDDITPPFKENQEASDPEPLCDVSDNESSGSHLSSETLELPGIKRRRVVEDSEDESKNKDRVQKKTQNLL